MSECPRCGGRWFAHDRELRVEVIEGERTTEVAAEQELVLDNREGSSPLRRTKEISREWSQQLEVSVEESSSVQNGIQIGKKDVATLTAMVENALKTTYRTVEESRRTYTETLPFDVPIGVRRTVTLTFRRIWQHGALRTEDVDGTVNEYPFRVIADLELDIKQVDSSA